MPKNICYVNYLFAIEALNGEIIDEILCLVVLKALFLMKVARLDFKSETFIFPVARKVFHVKLMIKTT